MVEMNRFERLKVWQLSYQLALDIYRMCDRFPDKERFRLIDQLCRAASSVPANIAEGNGRGLKRDFLRFLFLARGSLEKTKSHLLIAKGLGYTEEMEFQQLMCRWQEIGRMLCGLINSRAHK